MKHDNINDNRVNGFYKAIETNTAFTKGKQYYFKDGYTIDDNGNTRPHGDPFEFGTCKGQAWLKLMNLVPATDEMDIFNRVNEAAINCVDDNLECKGAECPYYRVPSCEDQMISDFKALRQEKKNRKEQEHEAMPIQGGFVYDSKRKSDKPVPVMIGKYVRDKVRFEVFKVIDVSIRWNNEFLGIQIELKGIDTGVKMLVNYKDVYEFFEDFDQWRIDEDGGSFNFVVLEDLSSESFTQVFRKGHLYSVVEGRVCNCDCDMRFKSFSEMAAYFGGNKLICTVGQGRLDDPTEGLYTGMAVYRGDSWRFTKGKIYRFVNGVVKDDVGGRAFVTVPITDYFVPVKNLEVGGNLT